MTPIPKLTNKQAEELGQYLNEMAWCEIVEIWDRHIDFVKYWDESDIYNESN